MNKVININFQGRILPIEELAYDLLKQYIDSLRTYFVNEEGCDEIINDIECRIAELCDERLKKGTPCITQEDMNLIISSIGRPADFEAQDGFEQSTASSANSANDSRNKMEIKILLIIRTQIFIEMVIFLKDYIAMSKTKYWAVFVVVLRITLS